MLMYLIDKNVWVLRETFGLNQFLQQHSCGHVD